MKSNEIQGLTAKQVKAVTLLLEGHGKEEAAKLTGVNPSTLFAWLKQPDFQAALTEGQMQIWNTALANVMASVEDAIVTLKDVCGDTQAKGSERVSAASKLLDVAMRGIVNLELERRVQQLEDKLGVDGNSPRSTD
jgi:transposase-like protein